MALEMEYLAAQHAGRTTVTDAELQAFQMNFVQMALVFSFTVGGGARHQDGDLQNGASAV